MKLVGLIETEADRLLTIRQSTEVQQLLYIQQKLLDELDSAWDVQISKSRELLITREGFDGPVWFGPVDYHDLPEGPDCPLNTRSEVEEAVRASYEDTGAGVVKLLEVRCYGVRTCKTSVKLKDTTDAFKAICIYNGWTTFDLTSDVVIEDLASHLEADVHE